jgi:hypothetical protein
MQSRVCGHVAAGDPGPLETWLAQRSPSTNLLCRPSATPPSPPYAPRRARSWAGCCLATTSAPPAACSRRSPTPSSAAQTGAHGLALFQARHGAAVTTPSTAPVFRRHLRAPPRSHAPPLSPGRLKAAGMAHIEGRRRCDAASAGPLTASAHDFSRPRPLDLPQVKPVCLPVRPGGVDVAAGGAGGQPGGAGGRQQAGAAHRDSAGGPAVW